MARILVSGSLAYDRIMNFSGRFSDHLIPGNVHDLSVSFVVDSVREYRGGTAGNIAYSLALLGEQPVVHAAVGHDFTPYREWCEQHAVDISGVATIADERTAAAYIMTDQQDNQIAAFHPGAMQHGGNDVRVDAIQSADWAIVAPGCVSDMVAYPKCYREYSLPFLFDPGQQITSLSKAQLENGILGARAVIVNDYELGMVIQKTGRSADAILEVSEMLVVTLGEQGSYIQTRESRFDIPPARPVAAVDPTGAGDAYRAGLIKGLAAGWPLEIAGRFASVVACYAVEKRGTQEHAFTFEEAGERYRENFGEELPD